MADPAPRDLRTASDPSDLRVDGLKARLDATHGMLDAISEAIYVQDAQGRFLDVNEGAARMYGYPRSFFIGKTPEAISAPGRNDLAVLETFFAKALHGEPQQFEYWGRKSDGSFFPKQVRLYPGTYLGQQVIVAVAQDISERKRAEQTQQATFRIAEAALDSKSSRELFERVHAIVRDLMPAENLYIALWDRASDTLSFPYWVDQEDPVPGKRRVGRGLTEYILRSGQPLLIDTETLKALQAAGEVAPQGTLSLDWLGVPLRNDSGVFGVLVVQSYTGGHRYNTGDRDLLAFVSSQVALAIDRAKAQSQQRLLTAAIDCAADPVMGIDSEAGFVFVNQAACAALGYTREEFERMNLSDIDPDVDLTRWPERWDLVRSLRSRRLEIRHLRKDGSIFPVEISSNFLSTEGQDIIFTYARDITSRKAAEEALRASEEKFSKTFHASPDAINLTRLSDGTYVDVSEGFEKISGWTREEVIGRSSRDLGLWAVPEDRQRMMEQLERDGEFTGLETTFRRKNGSLLTGLMSGKKMQVDGVPCVLSITRDITDRKAAEEALAAERGLFIGGPVMVFKWRTIEGWPVEYVSPNVQSILGYSVSDLVEGRVPFRSLFHPDDAGRVIQEAQEVETQGKSHFEQQYRLRTASGEYRWFYDFSAAASPGPNPTHYLGYLLDITDRRQAEDALRQSQKLESLGILAGGIAHDFNNLLTVVLGNLNLAQMHLPEQSPASPYLAKMEATVLRATDLTKQMLAYSGRGHFLVQPHDLNGLVRDVTHLLEVSIPKKIRLRFDLEPGLPAIQADATQIQQVVMNLVTNAADAIGDREGAIHLGTYATDLDERQLRSAYRAESLPAGRYVMLEVTDTGMGMTQEVMARIFDPFFTTKASGRGLGLSAMLGILRGHGAGLQIESEVGRGSTFRLCFPASSEQPAPCESGVQEALAHPMRGRILLVDDEELIRQTIGAALETLGLEVITARDGLEALEVFREAAPRPDLVLMDLTMPRMDGREAFEAMHNLDPSVPVVLSSGFTEQDSLRTLSGKGPAEFIQKPYQIKELRLLVQRVLGV
ncbi:PAS domain S-box protein [Geothrix sp. PMB-07]|uniref:PAS domain S-box protein n=1 Tax=Geothrix sp. PMB-07 TaxID=3068640 RepID=UPI0027422986|nr:PAS domain S-box protein [Geothrix sp. PMB-07]WLT33040.1 PAS domain S-box protein [Geothrix sp. PMB-07]